MSAPHLKGNTTFWGAVAQQLKCWVCHPERLSVQDLINRYYIGEKVNSVRYATAFSHDHMISEESSDNGSSAMKWR